MEHKEANDAVTHSVKMILEALDKEQKNLSRKYNAQGGKQVTVTLDAMGVFGILAAISFTKATPVNGDTEIDLKWYFENFLAFMVGRQIGGDCPECGKPWAEHEIVRGGMH